MICVSDGKETSLLLLIIILIHNARFLVLGAEPLHVQENRMLRAYCRWFSESLKYQISGAVPDRLV